MSEKQETPRQRLFRSVSDVVKEWADAENKTDSIDLRLQLLKMAGDVLFSVQGHLDDKRYEITEAAE